MKYNREYWDIATIQAATMQVGKEGEGSSSDEEVQKKALPKKQRTLVDVGVQLAAQAGTADVAKAAVADNGNAQEAPPNIVKSTVTAKKKKRAAKGK